MIVCYLENFNQKDTKAQGANLDLFGLRIRVFGSWCLRGKSFLVTSFAEACR
jgi:hypothetical protein